MNYAIVDTNVLVVANQKAPQASPTCVIACIQKLRQIQQEQILVIDDSWRILNEYKKQAYEVGQPGVGDAFLKWVLVNQANRDRCHPIPITPQENSFAEFPNDPALEKFDPSDRKFVAVALTHPEHPAITNAVDRDWYEFQQSLESHGIQIEFLCPEICKP